MYRKKLGSPEYVSPASESGASFSFWKKKKTTQIFFTNIFANICRPLSAFIYRDSNDINLVIFMAI